MTPKYFHVENGNIVSGPFAIPAPQEQPRVRVSGLELHNKTPEQLLTLGRLPQEIVGFEPFDPKTQIRTGPVHSVMQDKVVSTYTVRNKTAQQIDEEKEIAAVNGLDTPQNKVIRDALWELRQAVKGEIVMPDETKAQYTARLKDAWKNYK